ncbi:MAG: Ig-like domain-containing protein, partial [Bacteroidota bacterium]
VDGQAGTSPEHSINVEGVNIIDKYAPVGPQGDDGRFTSGSTSVTVNDGRLTIDAFGGFNSKITSLEISQSSSSGQPFFTNVTPANNSVNVALEDFQINVELVVPNGYELDEGTLAGNVNLFEVTGGGEVLVPSNSNDTGGGDAITLTPLGDLKELTTYIFRLSSDIEANLIGDVNDRLAFQAFESTFTTGEFDDTVIPIRDLTGVEFTKVFGEATLGTGTENQRFSSLAIGPDGKLYASTIGDFQSDGKIYRWDMASDGTLSNLEILSPELQGSPHPVTNATDNNNRLIIGFAFDPAATADNLIAYVTHSKASVTNGPEWDGKLTRLSGPNLATVQDLVIHLPRSTKDHLTNSIAFDDNGDLYINQGSNSAGGEPDAAWGFRPERLLAAAVLKLELDKLPGTLPLSAYTTDDISVINSASVNSLTMSNGTYNPYATNAPLTIFATGVRNAYDLVWHSNGWLYVPTNGTAGNNNTSPNSPSTDDYTLARRIDGLTSIPDVPALNGGETQKDWLFKTMGGTYHGHPNPYRGEFVLNHGGISYSGLPGQAEASYVDVAKYPDDLGPDPNYLEPAFDFGKNKSPNGVIEYKSDAFEGKLQGLLFVVRFSGQDDILGMDPKPTGDIQEAYNSIPGLSGFDDPLDVVEDPLTGNMYVSEYDRDNNGTARLTLLRAAIPASTGPKIASVDDELIFEITVNNDGENTDTKTIEITNEGNEALNISGVSITGAFGSQFNTVTPAAPQVIAPNESVEFSVTYAPDLDGTDLGYQEATLVFASDDENTPSFEIGLHGLKKAGFEGGEEPPLQDVVDALGIGIDVGWTNLANGTGPDPIGDEVEVERWIKSSSAPVTLVPVGRYSPGELLPFGWYTNDGSIGLNEIGALADGLANAQTLFPPLESGTTSFDPEGAVFGIYVDSNTFGRTNYTEDAINTGGVAHRTRIYPNRDREGNDIPNSYLIAFEDATNGDYQDYIFVLSNVEPFEDGTLALSFTPDQLDFTVAINQETVPTQSATLSANGGLTGSSVSLEASEPWVVLPPDGLGSLDIGVDPEGLGIGSYSATVTASAPNYVSAVVTINLEITNEIVYTYQFNFQDVDDVETSPVGYIDDVGSPFGTQTTSLGDLNFGWVLPGTETSADATENGRNRNDGTDDDALLKTFTIIGHRSTGTFPTLDWLVEVPNGQYYVNISVGDPNFTDSNHVLDVNGVTVLDFDQENDANNLVNFDNTELVEVTDGTLRLSLGATGVNAKPNYIRLAPFDSEQIPPLVTITLDGNSSAEGVYRGLVTATVQAESQNSSALESVEYQINDGPVLTYVDPIEISDEGDYVLKVIATDGNGNVTEETEEFSIEAPSGAILQVENLTKIPETTDGIPAEDYFTFHNVGATRANAIVNFSNTMRVNNTGTGNLIIDEIQLPSTANFEFVLRDFDGNVVASLPATVEPNEYLDVEIDFIRQTGGKGLYIEELTLVTNADNGLDGKVTLNGAYMSAFEGNNELTAQEVVEAFGFQTNTLSIVNDNGTITPQNTNPARPSSNYPLEENVNAGYEGDLVLSSTFVQADPSQSVRGIQLAALHGFATNGAEFVQANNNTRVGGILFNHNSNYYQTLLPKNNGGDINYDDAANITIPFRIKVAGFLTSGQGDDGNGNPALLGVRVFKVVDRDGNVVPNEYIVVQDF